MWVESANRFLALFFSSKKLGLTEFQNALLCPHAQKNLARRLILILADTLAQVTLPESGNKCVMVSFCAQFKMSFERSNLASYSSKLKKTVFFCPGEIKYHLYFLFFIFIIWFINSFIYLFIYSFNFLFIHLWLHSCIISFLMS